MGVDVPCGSPRTSAATSEFLLPIFKAMVKTKPGKQHAEELYGAIETRVHPITLNSLKKIMGKK
jgi:hypothetical protein